MSIFSLFQPKAADPANASANANPTVPNAGNTPAVVNDPNNPNASGNADGASPMDKFKDLWQPDANAKPDTPFSFNSDPAKLLDTAKTVDFTKIVSPEVMATIAKGGPEAQQAMMTAMNNMTQLSFAQSSHASAKIVESALQAQEQRFKEMLPSLIKQHTVVDSLKQNNPLMSDPSMAPLIGALQHQFTVKNPTATAEQISQHVGEFLNMAKDKIAGIQPVVVDKAKRGETDWSVFLGQ
jgi:hypothetical protein